MMDTLLFLASVGIISLSGVMMPGPVFAATMAQGYKDGDAGLRIALGHAIIEIPLIVLIYLGFATVLSEPFFFMLIGFVGGLILLWMGQDMIRSRKVVLNAEVGLKRTPMEDGMFTTITNPYWMLWWATVGAALVATATTFGLVMLPLFIMVHISCDAAWSWFLGRAVNRSKGLWDVKWHHLIIVVSGGIMLLFGIYFILSSLDLLV